mgnify:CR=1 FL=1
MNKNAQVIDLTDSSVTEISTRHAQEFEEHFNTDHAKLKQQAKLNFTGKIENRNLSSGDLGEKCSC